MPATEALMKYNEILTRQRNALLIREQTSQTSNRKGPTKRIHGSAQ